MIDTAHVETDKLISNGERSFKKTFSSSYNQAKQEAVKLLEKMKFTKQMTPQELLAEANKYGRFETMIEIITRLIRGATITSTLTMNKTLSEIYKKNYAYMTEQVAVRLKKEIPKVTTEETKEAIQNNPYKKIAVDKNKNTAVIISQLKSKLISAIATGGTAAAVLMSVKEVFNSSLNAVAKTNTTEATRLESMARQEVFNEFARKYGVIVIKRWKSRRDELVRDAHARADGQEAQYDKSFYVNGEHIEYPAAWGGKPENVINCRCRMEVVRILTSKGEVIKG